MREVERVCGGSLLKCEWVRRDVRKRDPRTN
jgi:hypothetical protein